MTSLVVFQTKFHGNCLAVQLYMETRATFTLLLLPCCPDNDGESTAHAWGIVMFPATRKACSAFACKYDEAKWTHRHASLNQLCNGARAAFLMLHLPLLVWALCGCMHTTPWCLQWPGQNAQNTKLQMLTVFLPSHLVHHWGATPAMLVAGLLILPVLWDT